MIHVISVVRDYAMYNRLVRDNPNLAGCHLVAYDNRIENAAIPVRYNDFLEHGNYGEDDWLVFCHEDFEFLEPLAKGISKFHLNRRVLYGIAGLDFDGAARGCILMSTKNGENLEIWGYPCRKAQLVSTVDCMCLFVHASLVHEFGLRFDEQLSFDIYTEDFCIAAREHYRLPTYVLPMRCQHYSPGIQGERFMQSYRYVCDKYAQTKSVYYTTTARRIGCGSFDTECYFAPPRKWPWHRLFQTYFTKDGYQRISFWAFRRFSLKIRRIDPTVWKGANPGTIPE